MRRIFKSTKKAAMVLVGAQPATDVVGFFPRKRKARSPYTVRNQSVVFANNGKVRNIFVVRDSRLNIAQLDPVATNLDVDLPSAEQRFLDNDRLWKPASPDLRNELSGQTQKEKGFVYLQFLKSQTKYCIPISDNNLCILTVLVQPSQ
jgi:hypothetical protein